MRFHTLDEWLAWQTTLHHSEIELGLERIARVWRAVWHGPLPFVVITVAGTNGKGSSVALLEGMLLAAGHRVGSFTSPHLVRYNERIRLGGEEASDARICQAFDRIDRARQDATLTYFEFSALAALEIFAEQRLDVAILEVGMGGRLDAVNIIDPDVALITTIGLDHTEWLGDTLDLISLEKAGIMRHGRPVVYAAEQAPAALVEYAERLGAKLFLAGRDFGFRRHSAGWEWSGKGTALARLPLPRLRGEYQLWNASGALMALQLVGDRLPVEPGAIAAGIGSTALDGRFQMVSGPPVTILDVAHNPLAAGVLAENMRKMTFHGETRAVFGMLADKDAARVAEIMSPLVDQWYLADLAVPRGLPPAVLAERMGDAGIDRRRVSLHATPEAAYRSARAEAGRADRLLVFGSFNLTGRVLDLLRRSAAAAADGGVD